MHRWRSVTLVAQAWLMTVAALLAGVPYFDCICPGGSYKPFCLGLRMGAAGCCSGGCHVLCLPVPMISNS